MKSLTKRFLTTALTLVFALCLCLGIGIGVTRTSADTPALADAVTSLSMINGASIRATENAGMRFKARVKKSEFDALSTTYEGQTVTMGMLIAPKDYLNETTTLEFGGGLTEGKSMLNIVKEVWGNDSTNIYYVFNAVITNIKDGNMDRVFVAKAYIKVGEEVIYTATQVERTPVYVATAADAAGAIDSELKTNIQKYFDILDDDKYASAELSTDIESQTITLRQGEILDFSAAYGDTAVVPTASVGDDTIAFVEGTKIYAEKQGETTVTFTVNEKSVTYNLSVDGKLDFYIRNNCDNFGSDYKIANATLSYIPNNTEMPTISTSDAWRIDIDGRTSAITRFRTYLIGDFKANQTYTILVRNKIAYNSQLYINTQNTVDVGTYAGQINWATSGSYEHISNKKIGYTLTYTPTEDTDTLVFSCWFRPTQDTFDYIEDWGVFSFDVVESNYYFNNNSQDWLASNTVKTAYTEDSSLLYSGETSGYRITNTSATNPIYLVYNTDLVVGNAYTLILKGKILSGNTPTIKVDTYENSYERTSYTDGYYGWTASMTDCSDQIVNGYYTLHFTATKADCERFLIEFGAAVDIGLSAKIVSGTVTIDPPKMSGSNLYSWANQFNYSYTIDTTELPDGMTYGLKISKPQGVSDVDQAVVVTLNDKFLANTTYKFTIKAKIIKKGVTNTYYLTFSGDIVTTENEVTNSIFTADGCEKEYTVGSADLDSFTLYFKPRQFVNGVADIDDGSAFEIVLSVTWEAQE